MLAQTGTMAPDARPATIVEGGALDSISTTNGGLQLHIPLWSIKQRGNLSLTFSLRYNSPDYFVDQECDIPNSPCLLIYDGHVQGIYVTASTDVAMYPVENIQTNSQGQYVASYYWQVITPDSGTHSMVSLGNDLFRAVDGTGWLFNDLTYTLTSRDGVRYVFAGSAMTTMPYANIGRLLYVEDTNGNRITLSYSSSTSNGITTYTFTGWTDTLGRSIPSSVYSAWNASGPIPMPANGWVSNPASVPNGCPSTAISATSWTPPGASGSITYCFANTQVNTDFWNGDPKSQGPHKTEYELNEQVLDLQSVILLDGSSYTFEYSPLSGDSYNYGELTQITLPAGGTIGYTWAENFTGCPSETTLGNPNQYNRRSFATSRITNDGSGDHTWTYSLVGTQSGWMYTVTDPLSDTTVHTISNLAGNCSMYETEADYSDVNLGLLKAVKTSYQTLPIVDYFPVGSPITTATALPTSETVTWKNGAIRTSSYAYDAGFSGSGPMGSGTFPYGNVILQTESDYGKNNSAGQTLKTTSTDYRAFHVSTALTYNMLDRVSSVTVTDGITSTTQTALYSYDESSLASGNASGTGWDASPPNGSVRGNLTSVQKFWDTSGAYLKWANTYTNTGLISTATEPSNPTVTPAASTSYAYDGSFDGGFLTKVTDALGHYSQYTYDMTTGHVLSATDPNLVTTSYTYDDDLRLSAVTRPGGSHNLASNIGYTYPDPVTRVTTSQMSSGSLETDTVFYDGLGRVVQTKHADPEGDVFADTIYDAVGRVQTQSTPYRTKTDLTYGLTTLSYDGLGRELSVQNPDTSSSSYSYAGATTQLTNESNGSVTLKKLTQVDGLGRLTSVCEISAATPVVGTDSPADCGMELTGTGYLTTYTQSLRGMTKATQGAQTRSFVYDSLGQITDSTNPESGHIQYVYDNDGNVITKSQPSANSQTGSVTITVNYAWDSLHRLLSKTYTGSTGAATSTPSASYHYDETEVGGVLPERPVGRLTSESTTLNGTVQTETIYSYDTNGKVESHYQCVLAKCASSTFQDVEYDTDGAGHVTKLTTGNTGYTATYNYAGHLTNVVPLWVPDANHPAEIFGPVSGQTEYAPGGGWNAVAMGNGTIESYSYSSRWVTGMSVTGLISGTPASPSTGTIVVSGTEQTLPAIAATITVGGAETLSGGNWDTGTLTILFEDNSNRTYSESVSYGRFSSAASIASALAAKFSNDYLANGLCAHATGSVITFNLKGSVTVGSPTLSGPTTSFTLTPSSWPPKASKFDSGTVTVTINNIVASATWGQGSTAASVASAVASAIQQAGTGVISAGANGNTNTVTVQSVQTGAATDWQIQIGVSYDTADFSNPSFSFTPNGMSGGSSQTNQTGVVYDYALQHAADGQITQAADSVNGTWNYAYDEMNRLLTAQQVDSNNEVLKGFSWDYDRYGNRWHQNLTAGSGNPTVMGFNATSNRASSMLTYDVAGNVLNDSSHAYLFDADNRIAQVDNGLSYIYDAEGRRVGKSNGTVYVVGLTGDVLDEIDSGTWMRSEISVGGRHLATATPTTVTFTHADWLGTERARTNASGLVCEEITSQPFGDAEQKIVPSGMSGCDPSPDFFAGKPRDTESNLDDFGARYMSSQWGRWMSADWTAGSSAVPYATLTNPQSLNLYAYVGNDPIDGQDPDGHAQYSRGPYLSYQAADAFGSGYDPSGIVEDTESDTLNVLQNSAPSKPKGTDTKASTTPASASGGSGTAAKSAAPAQQQLTPQKPRIGPSQTQEPAAVIPVEVVPFSPSAPLTNQSGQSVSGNYAGVLVTNQVVDAKGYAVVDPSMQVMEHIASTPNSVNPPPQGDQVFQTFGGRYVDVYRSLPGTNANSTTTQTYSAVAGQGDSMHVVNLSTQNRIRMTSNSNGYPTISVTNVVP
jgi:RHS repeat-associated protein